MKIKTFILALAMALFALSAAGQDPARDTKTKPDAPKTEAPKTDAPKTDSPAKPDAGKSAKTAPTRAKGAPIDFPEVDGWKKSGLLKYPQRELGYSVNYDAEDGSRVFWNGSMVETDTYSVGVGEDCQPGAGAVRCEGDFMVPVPAANGFVVVAAYGDLPLSPVHQGRAAFGVANAIRLTQ